MRVMPACGAQAGSKASGASSGAGTGPKASEAAVRPGDAGVGAASRVPLPQEGPVSRQVQHLCRAVCMCLPIGADTRVSLSLTCCWWSTSLRVRVLACLSMQLLEHHRTCRNDA